MLAPGLNPDKGQLHAEAEAFEYVASLQVNMSLLASRRLQAEAGVHSREQQLEPPAGTNPTRASVPPPCKVELMIAEAVVRTVSTHGKQGRGLAQSKCATVPAPITGFH